MVCNIDIVFAPIINLFSIRGKKSFPLPKTIMCFVKETLVLECLLKCGSTDFFGAWKLRYVHRSI